MKNSIATPNVALYVTCLVNLSRPSVGFAAVKLLTEAGCRVSIPEMQTCCGQPAYNSGDQAHARDLATKAMDELDGYDYVVIPSGSCGSMIATHYPKLFADDVDLSARADDLAGRTWELITFLSDIMDVTPKQEGYNGKVTYHDSCAGLRELNIRDQPRKLLATIDGLELNECQMAETCCGFGGLFCVKYPDISGVMVDRKIDDLLESGADTVIAGDLGCLLQLASHLAKRKVPIKTWHVAEILAGLTSPDHAPINPEEL